MNRTFLAQLTPARARLLQLMNRHIDIEIDDAVKELAGQDRISSRVFAELGMSCPQEQEAVQFIHDTNFRAGIPVSTSERTRAIRVVDAAIAIAGIDDVVHVDGSTRAPESQRHNDIVEFDFDTLLPLRKKLLIVNLDHLDNNASHQLLGKIFPRVVCVGSMMVQYSFAFGGQNSTTTRMGTILYPEVEESISKSSWKKNERQAVLAMGVYPDLLKDFNSAPKTIDNNFVMKRTKY